MDKKFLIAVLMSLGTVWLFNHMMRRNAVEVSQGGVVDVAAQRDLTPGQPVQVPTTEVVYKPLVTTVAFSDQPAADVREITVETPLVQAVFSQAGGTLTSLAFKEHLGKGKKPLTTLALTPEKGGHGAFLVGFEQAAPLAYQFVAKNKLAEGTQVVFKGENDHAIVRKTFILRDASYQCDMVLEVEPKHSDKAVTPRILFPAPYVQEIADDTISVCSWDEQKESLDTYEPAGVRSSAWFWVGGKPLFGAQDRYFAHAVVADQQSFVQRGYIRVDSAQAVTSILEGPRITKKAVWHLSFYLGPKTQDSLHAVDERLPQLLSFGFLNPICKFLLKLLAYFYELLGNFGLAIIVMTIALRLPFTPLTIYAKKQADIFARYQPTINRIQMKYRHDKATQHQELMRFYQEHNLTPQMQLAGCFPQLIQMPILFALFRVLNNYVDLYQAPFGGWIFDLSARDPYYLLPLLLCLSMLLLNRQNPMQDEKQRVIMIFFSILVSAVFATFSAGLVLYWLVGNLISVGEDYLRKAFFK